MKTQLPFPWNSRILNTPSPVKKNAGAALLIFLITVVLGAAAFFVSALNKANQQIERDRITANALAKAKDALIGWSAANGTAAGNPRPGELPCPDTSAPGSINYGYQAGSCAAGAIGRLPWRTLGIEELKDSTGETLWYAIDGAFRTRGAGNSQPINSDTRPTMQVYASDGATLLTPAGSEAVAIVFAAGAALSGQARGTAAQQTTAANYLDSAGSPTLSTTRNNATANGPFIKGTVKDASGNTLINDQLLVITARDLMTAVERRVMGELKTILQNYYTANHYYPYPAKYNAAGCTDVGSMGYFSNCQSDATVCRGRFPDSALPTDWSGTYALPGWLSYNLWGQVIYYSVGTNYLSTAPSGCSTTLTLNGTPGVRGLFIMPGTPLGSKIRNSPSESTTLSDYLEDATNQVGWTGSAPSADNYVTPTTASNDRLQTLP